MTEVSDILWRQVGVVAVVGWLTAFSRHIVSSPPQLRLLHQHWHHKVHWKPAFHWTFPALQPSTLQTRELRHHLQTHEVELVKSKEYSSYQLASQLREHTRTHTRGITQCYLLTGTGDIPAFTTAKLVHNLATLDGMQRLNWTRRLVTYQDAIPTRKRSLRKYTQWCYHYATPVNQWRFATNIGCIQSHFSYT